MIVLGLESSGEVGGAAVVRDQVLLDEQIQDLRMAHASKLLGLVDRVLKASDVSPQALDAVGVSVGPGSFTGLRIGLATAKGLALALGLPVGPVPTLDALAYGVRHAEHLVLAATDAKRDEFYYCFYRFSEGEISWRSPFRVSPAHDVVRHAVELRHDDEALAVVGTGASPVTETFPRSARQWVRAPSDVSKHPMPSSVARLAPGCMVRGMELDALEPLYLRKSDAETKRERDRER